MTLKLKGYFFKNREQIYILLITILLTAYVFSYALLSIFTFLVFAFFFFDKKEHLLNKWQIIKSNKIISLYVLCFIFQCVGLIYSTNLGYGLRRINTSLPILFLPAIVCSEKLNKDLFYKAIGFLRLFIVLIFSVFLFVHLILDGRTIDVFSLYVLTVKLGISQFYVVFILIIPLLFTLNELLSKKRLLLNVFFLVFLLFFIFLLTNKTAIIMLFLIFMISLMVYFKDKKLTFKLSVLFLTPLLIIFLIFNVPGGVKQKFKILINSTDFNIETIITKNSVTLTKNTLEHRLLINYITVNEIIDNFPFGVGTGDYQDVLNSNYEALNFKQGMRQRLNNHNQYLSEFLKTGILSGTIFLFIMFYLLRCSSFKNQYYIYIVLSFAIACLFESYLDRQHGVIIFAFIIPLFLQYEIENKSI
ncbi:O-antigen ligase family protein [Winogradskyella sediminis]|uniref:O-antigen ligase like membrane protein n=1 Tax=Winogradskyella sediminis TaxID=1382466 RepID=A0A1H1S6H4_9FLAO|nr:O-antigen ligase family protein [Winogradskyella sediminis]SDS43503.1 O-antigen ligase like membrane protein [Winogradskyella sediminis]